MSRIEQLGLPIPRKLISTKQEFDNILERGKLQNLEKYLEKSMNTIYCKMVAHKKRSCLSEQQKRKKVIFSNQEWLKHIAKLKKIFEPETMERPTGKIDIQRINRLSQPRHQPYPEVDISVIADATLKYVATERIINLAQPRKEIDVDTVYEIPRIPFPTNPNYAAVQSMGIEKLSLPLHPRQKHLKVATDVRCSYSPVSKGALKYEPSVLIRKLAKPKSYEDEELGDPYKVKKKALIKLPKNKEKIFKAMATPIEWKVTPKFELNDK